jgi:hypothetical protein
MQHRNRNALHSWLIFALLTLLLPSKATKTQAQGITLFRLPFDGNYRVTAYFDHKNPTYESDPYNPIVVYSRFTSYVR